MALAGWARGVVLMTLWSGCRLRCRQPFTSLYLNDVIMQEVMSQSQLPPMHTLSLAATFVCAGSLLILLTQDSLPAWGSHCKRALGNSALFLSSPQQGGEQQLRGCWSRWGCDVSLVSSSCCTQRMANGVSPAEETFLESWTSWGPQCPASHPSWEPPTRSIPSHPASHCGQCLITSSSPFCPASRPAPLPGMPALQGSLHPSRTWLLSRTPSLPHPHPEQGGWGSAAPPRSWADASPSHSWVAAAAPSPRPSLPAAHPAGRRGRVAGAGEGRSGGAGARGKPCGGAGSRRPAGPAARAEPPASVPTTAPAAARRAPPPPARPPPPPRRIPAPHNPRRSRTEPRTAPRRARPPSPQPTPRVPARTSRSGVGSPARRHGWVLSGLIPDEKLMGPFGGGSWANGVAAVERTGQRARGVVAAAQRSSAAPSGASSGATPLPEPRGQCVPKWNGSSSEWG